MAHITYLKLPIRFKQFFENKKLPSCNLLDSVYRNLHLLITTMQGENKNDPLYGSHFWESDYDTHLANDVRREMIINSLKTQISLYEKRITEVTVDVNVRLSNAFLDGMEIQKKKIEIVIKGKIKRSMEPFTFMTGFFISPYNLD